MRALLVGCVLALALSAGLTDAVTRHHHLARLRPVQQPSPLHTDAFVEAEADAEATVEAEAADEAEEEADAEAEAEAEADVAVDAEAQAAVAALVAAAEATDRAQMTAEFERHHSRRTSACGTISFDIAVDADAVSSVGAYHANHLTACQALHAYLAGLGGGFGAAAGPAVDDAKVIVNWVAAAGAPPDVGVRNAAQHIVDYVRWGHRRGLAHGAVCTQVLLTPVVAAYDRRAAPVAPALHLPRYTIGLEWELHWLQVLPANEFWPASSFVLWRSSNNLNPAGQPWMTLVTDHSGRLPLTLGNSSMTILEVAFGPAYCDANAGVHTATAISDSRKIIAHLKHVLEHGSAPAAASAAAAAGPVVGAVSTLGFASAVAVENGLRNRLTRDPTHVPVVDWKFDAGYSSIEGKDPVTEEPVRFNFHTPGFADPTVMPFSRGNVVYRGPQRVYHFRPLGQKPDRTVAATWAEQWTVAPPVGAAPPAFNNEYIQTNFLMPVSAMASARYVAIQTGAWRQDAMNAARLAARSYLLASGVAPAIGALPAADRGDLLGAYTGLFHQALYRIITNTDLYTRVESGIPTSSPKNWFDYMYKTSAHRVFMLLRPAAAHVLNLLYAATDLGAGTNTADAAMNHLRVALAAATDPLVVAWARKMTGAGAAGAKIRAWGSKLLRDMLRMSYPTTNLEHPEYSAAPSGSDPPAHVVTNGVVPSVVIESRQLMNSLNVAVRAGDAGSINEQLKQLQRQFTWNGSLRNQFCV